MFNETFWVAVSFVALMIVIFKPVKKALLSALDGRSAQIQKELDDAMRLKEEAEDLLVSYKRKQKEVLEEASLIIEHAEKEVERITAEAHATLEAELNRREALALQKIASYEANVLKDIRNAAVDQAIHAIQKLAADHMGKEVAENLINGSITNISKSVH